MDYFSKFLRSSNHPPLQSPIDRSQEFHNSWDVIRNTLLHPDERQLARGIKATDVPAHLKSLVDSLVWESTRTEEGGTGACLEYLLKNDVLGTLVRLSETDRPSGIQAEVLRAVQNMVVLMDEQFLVHSAIHRAVLRLLRNCAGDDLQEQLDGRKVMGAAGTTVRGHASEYEEDLVNLLCILCSRIRTYRELLMIFFHDKHWHHSDPLFSVEEVEEEDDDDDDDGEWVESENLFPERRGHSPSPSQMTIKSGSAPPLTKKPEYEFLLFNYLLRFVHREGQIGDFARAGLLFLMDVAMSPGEPRSERVIFPSSDVPTSEPIRDAELALAEYILDGDFSEVLGAGLGAVYSLLPSKLVFHSTATSVTSTGNSMVIGSAGLDPAEEREKQELAKLKARAMGAEDASNPEFKSRLDHFLKLLEFLQDVLRGHPNSATPDAPAIVGVAIGRSIIDAVRRIFLENILYPSILECSDVDGSAVAVMSYIEVMVRTLGSGQLADLLVDFLVNEDNDDIRVRQRPSSLLALGRVAISEAPTEKSHKLRRRKSSAMVLLEREAPESRRRSLYFTSMGRFTLRDLLLSNLRSNLQAAATSALQLLQLMLSQHPQVTSERLLLVIPDPTATSFPHPPAISSVSLESKTWTLEEDDDDETFTYPGDRMEDIPGPKADRVYDASQFLQPETTYSTHEREMGMYLALVSRVDPSHSGDAFSTGYDHYLRDALLSIQGQVAYQRTDEAADPEPRQNLKHRLNINDPILSLILESLRKFFSNSPEFNITLTGVLATLSIHPDRSLAGWLTFTSNDIHQSETMDIRKQLSAIDDDGDDRSIDFEIETKLANDAIFLPASSMDENSRPVLHTILHGLVTQLERYRGVVDNFDTFLLERRQGLLFSENITDALTFPLDFVDGPVSTTSAPEISPSRSKPKASTTNSFVSFLTPKKTKTPKPLIESEPTTPVKKPLSTNTVASPFGRHYENTGSIFVEPFLAPIPLSSPWTPTKTSKWNATEEDVFMSTGWSEEVPPQFNEDESQQVKAASVTLSQLLDNIVILEESIKELVAIIHARRSLGVDSVRYI